MSMHESKIPAQLEARIEMSDGLAIFRFALARDFSFDPGQYATLWLTHGGKTLARPYSIASSSSEKRHLEFYINLVKEGKLTPSLWESEVIEGLRSEDPGTRGAITGPRGRFVMDPEDFRDYVFVASGTGLAPFISMIRKLNEDFLLSPKTFRPRRIYLIHGVSYPTHLGYRDELERLAAETMKDPKRKLALLYLPTISRPYMDSSWTGLKGRAETLLETPSVRRLGTPDLVETIKAVLSTAIQPQTHAVYVCGHPGTVDHVVNALSKRGFRLDADIKREKYYP
jgi:NAD(P)H-flavin reductase